MSAFELENAIRNLVSAMTRELSGGAPGVASSASPQMGASAVSPQMASMTVENIASAVAARIQLASVATPIFAASPQVASVTVENIASAVAARIQLASVSTPIFAASPQAASVTVENIASAVAARIQSASTVTPIFAASPQMASMTVENIASAVAARIQPASAAMPTFAASPETAQHLNLRSEDDARRVASVIASTLSGSQKPESGDVDALAKELGRFIRPAAANPGLPVQDVDIEDKKTGA